MANPRWRTTILNFRSLLLSIAFSRCTSVSLLLVHKRGQQKRSLYQYYLYFTYLSGKIIRNIEKLEYDVTVTSSLGVASQDWVWGFLVWRWSLCVNFTTLALLVPDIKRGGPRSPPPVTDWPKKPSLNRVKVQSSDNILAQTASPKVLAIPSYVQFRKDSKIGHFLKYFIGGTKGKSPKM